MVFGQNYILENDSRERLLEQKNLLSLLAIALSCVFYGISAGINFSNFSNFLMSNGLSASEISDIMSVEMLGNLIGAPFLAILSSRIGLYRLLKIVILLRGAALASFSLGTSEVEWGISIVCFGISGFILYAGIFQWVNLIAKDQFRGRYISLVSIAFGLGIAMGYFISRLKEFEQLGYSPFYASILISFLMIIPLKFAKKDWPEKYQSVGIELNKIINFAYIPIISFMACEYVYYAISDFFGLFAILIGYSLNDAYFVMVIFSLSGILFGIPIGFIIDTFSRVKILMILSLTISISMLLIKNSRDEIVMLSTLLGIISASIIGIKISSLAMLGDLFDRQDFIMANSVVLSISSIGGYAGIKSTGYLLDEIGPKGFIFSISSLFLVVLALLLIEVYRQSLKWKRN